MDKKKCYTGSSLSDVFCERRRVTMESPNEATGVRVCLQKLLQPLHDLDQHFTHMRTVGATNVVGAMVSTAYVGAMVSTTGAAVAYVGAMVSTTGAAVAYVGAIVVTTGAAVANVGAIVVTAGAAVAYVGAIVVTTG